MWLYRYTTDLVRCVRVFRWYWVERYFAPLPTLAYGPCARAGALAAGLLAAPLPPAWPDFSGPPIDFYGPGFGDAYGRTFSGSDYGPLGAFGGGYPSFGGGGGGYARDRSGHGRVAHGGPRRLGDTAGVPGDGLPGVAGPPGAAPVGPMGGVPAALAGTPGDVVPLPGPFAPAVPDVPTDVPEPKTIGLLLLALAATLGLHTHTHASGRRTWKSP